jgi:hypothetical protein
VRSLNPGVIAFAALYLAGRVILSRNKDFNFADSLIELIPFLARNKFP